MRENIVLEKAVLFSRLILVWYRQVYLDPVGKAVGHQLLRSGTSVGANISEAQGASSVRDFINKLAIAEKEAKESHYWIKVFDEKLFKSKEQRKFMLESIEEIIRILNKILKTTRRKK